MSTELREPHAQLYDPATNTWGNTSLMSTGRVRHTATLLPNGKVLVTGGDDGGSTINELGSAELYDPATNAWSPAANLVFSRTAHTATLLPNGQVLVAGGYGASGNCELYDPATNTWSRTGTLNTWREFATATLLPSGQVLVAGGLDIGPLTSAELYDPATGMWSATGSLSTARLMHSAVLLGNGKVMVMGGTVDIHSTAFISSVEVFW